MFRTELTIAPQERQLTRTARVLTVGSCFADTIGERLRLNKISTLVNPFGTVFQPLALAQLLRAAAGEEQDWQQHVVEARGRWQSYDFHSTIGADSPVELLQTIQDTVRRVGDFLRTTDTVVLTLGTAWAYRLRETGELVSNLHKLPADLFEKELLTADEIVNGLAEVHALVRRLNPNIRIVLTVSPVRHIKDTLTLNAVSKSVLRVACHYLSELLPGVSYFPAYELLTDDLRDYRFYAADMLHPSEVAENYIWERFTRAYFDADFGRFLKEWAAVRQSLGHRPLHPGAPEHRTFLDQTRERLERLANQGVEVRQELRDVQRQLAALPPPRPTRVLEAELDDDEERIDIGNATAESTNSTLVSRSVSPPERRQENRRDGRRSERSGQDRRNSRPAQPVEEEQVYTNESLIPAPTTPPVISLEVNPLEPLALEEAAYPAKKKKRRSRGGAKRTARKHAALLAAEQQSVQSSSLAETELIEELAQENADFTVEAPVAELPSSLQTATAEAELAGGSTSSAPLPPLAQATSQPSAPVRKRGTGPTPKKSKVITKSGLVKRGNRNSLYRSPAPEPVETSVPAPAHPATAPIISPPIIPEMLLERPAVDTAFFPPPMEAPQEAPTPTEPTSATPAVKPKRGRPKATTPRTAPTPTPSADVNPPSSTPEPTVPVVEETIAPAKPAKKPTAKTPKATKPVAPKKAPAKTAATRRSRPPGKKTPPPADNPAT
ncbi:hypothetical protein GO988_19290 [Hymenobacter sp. HMF4947]|uniref:GSCFA domain-containing protein n=1 Tax=Hymenobacter ginkgonis TaxID=2682976 RepID=A0A7K1TJW4_9BACT|nr:GSCFA domain-containing protein [Hymenobacter ginkgonis]MVN78481.1 hypothetical protein [Hymenobacter ginkgonis]